MKSKIDANVFVVGDACIPGDMPKSAFSANSQAKVAAMVIRGELGGARTFPARYSNTCWSLIETDDDVKIGGTYEPGDGKIKTVTTFVSQRGRAGRRAQAELQGVDRLVQRHRGGHFRVNCAALRIRKTSQHSEVVRGEAGVLGDPREHAWTDLIPIVEREDVVRPSRPVQVRCEPVCRLTIQPMRRRRREPVAPWLLAKGSCRFEDAGNLCGSGSPFSIRSAITRRARACTLERASASVVP